KTAVDCSFCREAFLAADARGKRQMTLHNRACVLRKRIMGPLWGLLLGIDGADVFSACLFNKMREVGGGSPENCVEMEKAAGSDPPPQPRKKELTCRRPD